MIYLLTALKIFGIILLCLFLVFLAVLLLILFVPFHYSFSGDVNDPEGHSELLHIDLKRDVAFKGELRWLMGAIRAVLSYDGAKGMSIRLYGLSVPIAVFQWINGILKKEAEPKKKEPPAPKEKLSLDEKIDRALTRILRLYYRLDDIFYVLGTERGARAVNWLILHVGTALKNLIPSQWGLTGVVGLGDPALSANVFAVQGLLYPVTAGHVALGTDYELYRYDLHGAARGSFRLFSVAFLVGVRAMLNRDVWYLIGRLRRGPR